MKAYQPPKLRSLGSLSSLTLGRMGSCPQDKTQRNGGPYTCKS